MSAAPALAEVATDPLAARLRELRQARGQEEWAGVLLELACELTLAEAGAVLGDGDPPVVLASHRAATPEEAPRPAWVAAAARAHVARGVWAGSVGTGWVFAVPVGHAAALTSPAARATLVLELATRQPLDLVLTRERLVTLAALAEATTQAAAGSMAIGGALASAAVDAMLQGPDQRRGLFAAAGFLAKGAPGVERLALARLSGGRVMALVLADQPAVDPTADLPRLLAGLIEEADDHDGPLPTSADGPLTPAQQAYAARFGARPLLAQMAPNHRLGLATTFREGAVPAEAIPSLTSALALLERTLSPRPPRLNPRSRRTWLIAMAGVAAVVGVLAVLPRAAVVEAPATLQPDWQQVVSAPYDGVVDASSVQPGDAVVASSTVLARLMTREIELEIAAARARAANDQRDATVARAASQPAQEQLALLSAKRNEAQLALLEHRLAMSQLRSPVSGVIVSGDLRRSIGQPVMRGQTLFEIAPPAATRAEIHVLDEDVTLIAPGQAVRILPAAEPDRPRRAIVQRIRPMAEVVQGRNAFLVVAQLEPDDAPLRPGSEGVARIETGQTTWLVALLRQPVRYLRRLLWI